MKKIFKKVRIHPVYLYILSMCRTFLISFNILNIYSFFFYLRWQNTKDETEDVHISHPVTNFEFFYEPFYVAPDVVPPHDERFIGYGYTRNSQVCCVDRIIFNIL